MFNSIRNRLIFLLIAFTLLPLVVLRIVAYPKMQSDIERELVRNLQGVESKQEDLIRTWMNERQKDVRVIGDSPLILKSLKITKKDADYASILLYLERLRSEYGYKEIFLCNSKGLVTISTMENMVGSDVSQKSYFTEATRGKTSVSEVHPSDVPLINENGEKEVGVPTMFVSAPVKDDSGVINGVIVLRLDVNVLSDMVVKVELGTTGEAYLVNREGYMITESRFVETLREMGVVKKRCSLELRVVEPGTDVLTHGVTQCIAGTDGYDARGYKDYAGVTVLGVWKWMPEFNWGLVTEIDKDEGYGVVYNLQYVVNAILLFLAFPIIIAAVFIARQLTTACALDEEKKK